MLPHTDRGLLDKRARDQIQTLVICLKKTTLSALRRCVEKRCMWSQGRCTNYGKRICAVFPQEMSRPHLWVWVHDAARETQCSFRSSHSCLLRSFIFEFLFIQIPSVPVQWDMVISNVMISRHMQIVGRKAAQNKFQQKKTPTIY